MSGCACLLAGDPPEVVVEFVHALVRDERTAVQVRMIALGASIIERNNITFGLARTFTFTSFNLSGNWRQVRRAREILEVIELPRVVIESDVGVVIRWLHALGKGRANPPWRNSNAAGPPIRNIA